MLKIRDLGNSNNEALARKWTCLLVTLIIVAGSHRWIWLPAKINAPESGIFYSSNWENQFVDLAVFS